MNNQISERETKNIKSLYFPIFKTVGSILFAVSFLVSIVLFTPGETWAQGVVECRQSLAGGCILDGANPIDCAPDHEPPCGVPPDYSECCTTQNFDECSDVECVLIGSTPPPPPPPPPPPVTPPITPGGPPDYDCILGNPNCFQCTWVIAVGCVGEDFNNVYPPIGCTAGNQTDTSRCAGIPEQYCGVGNEGFNCVEVYPGSGYFCTGSTFGCYPCAGNDDWRCDPPQYSDATTCELACSGQIPTMYRCDHDLGCVESQTGVYEGYQACLLECGPTQFVFCDEDGNVTDVPETVDGPNRIYTAIGCVPAAGTGEFTIFLFQIGLAMAGGIALLLLAIAGILIKMSAGDPGRVSAGTSLAVAALAGLLVIMFAAFVLRIAGIEIFGIPNL